MYINVYKCIYMYINVYTHKTQFHAALQKIPAVEFSDQTHIKFKRYSPVRRTIEATSRRVAKASFTVLSSKPEVCNKTPAAI